jgi:hypothetical protein
MDTDRNNKKENSINTLTEKIIGAAYTVANTLGCGFLEKVYENALMIELRKEGLRAEQQKGIVIFYDSQVIGEYYADLLIDIRVHLWLIFFFFLFERKVFIWRQIRQTK